MLPKLVRPFVVGGLMAGLLAGCGDQVGKSPDLPPSTPPTPSLTGADAAKANNPRGGSSTAPDPNPGSH